MIFFVNLNHTRKIFFAGSFPFFCTTFCWEAMVIGMPLWWNGTLNRPLFFPFPFFLFGVTFLSLIPSPSRMPLAMARSITSLGGVGALSGWEKIIIIRLENLLLHVLYLSLNCYRWTFHVVCWVVNSCWDNEGFQSNPLCPGIVLLKHFPHNFFTVHFTPCVPVES